MFKTIEIEGRTIIVEGIGKMFYQDGFPMPIAVNLAKEKGIKVSFLHLAKELLCEWAPKTVIRKMSEDFSAGILGDEELDLELITKFVHLEYKDRQEMIFEYLFGCSYSSCVENYKTNKPIDKVFNSVLNASKEAAVDFTDNTLNREKCK